MLDPVTGNLEEINECKMMPDICQHGTCMNLLGSFTCDCEPGYLYDEGSHQCIDRNECSQAGPSPCHGNAQCKNTQVGARVLDTHTTKTCPLPESLITMFLHIYLFKFQRHKHGFGLKVFDISGGGGGPFIIRDLSFQTI